MFLSSKAAAKMQRREIAKRVTKGRFSTILPNGGSVIVSVTVWTLVAAVTAGVYAVWKSNDWGWFSWRSIIIKECKFNQRRELLVFNIQYTCCQVGAGLVYKPIDPNSSKTSSLDKIPQNVEHIPSKEFVSSWKDRKNSEDHFLKSAEM